MSLTSKKVRVPVLQVNIPSPCQENWHAMSGDAQRRHCERCDHEVHDLSALSPAAARELLTNARPGELCVRGYFTADGTPVTHAEVAKRRALKSRTTVALLAAAVLSVAGCEESEGEAIESVQGSDLALAVQRDASVTSADVVELTGEVAAPVEPACKKPESKPEADVEPQANPTPHVKMGKIAAPQAPLPDVRPLMGEPMMVETPSK